MKRILIYPEMEKYLMGHYEYLIRYLGKEFFIEQAVLTETPFGDYRHFIGMRNHDSYDLLIPHFTDHTFLPNDLHYKIACVLWDTKDLKWPKEQVCGATSPAIEKTLESKGIPYHSLRIGVDTNMFAPYELAREDDLFHIGFIGEYTNPRRNTKAVFEALKDIPGTRFMAYSQVSAIPTENLKESVGGDDFYKHVVGGGKYWTGIPNCYNSVDVLVRLDTSWEYGFPVLEAASCGVPSICTNMGNQNSVIEAGGAIGINGFSGLDNILKEAREAVIKLRDNRNLAKEMGAKGREEIVTNWQWPNFVGAWRDFITEGLERAHKGVI